MIETLHTQIFSLIGTDVTGFAQGFYEYPKTIDDQSIPAYSVYFQRHENEILSSNQNQRTYFFTIDVIYDKESISDTQTVLSGLVTDTINALEDKDNYSLGGNASYTLPTECERAEEVIAGKTYLIYRITLPVIISKSI